MCAGELEGAWRKFVGMMRKMRECAREAISIYRVCTSLKRFDSANIPRPLCIDGEEGGGKEKWNGSHVQGAYLGGGRIKWCQDIYLRYF